MKEMVGGCCVCSDERGWPENPLVYCDGQNCTVAVHQACYGIVTVPTGPWYCRKCESQERSARVRCELCPSRDGALKKTDNQGWAHVVCALYIPEVRFGNVTTMEPIILQLIPPERYSKTCYICQEIGKGSRANAGACMQCNKSGCKQQFHVTCAQGLGLLCEEAGNYLDNVKYCGYCQHHYSKLKKGGNVKTIPPYKPVTHETGSSDATSSPEKELEPSTVTATPSSSSAGHLKMNSNQAANSSTLNSSSSSSSSSKQRKSSSTSKLTSSSSTSGGNISGSNVGSGGSSGGGGSGAAGGTTTSSNSSNSKNSSSSSSSSKDKDKHSKSLNKISSSSKNQDKESSTSSSASSSTRDKSKSSKSNKDLSNDHGGSSSSVAITSTNVAPSASSTSGAASNLTSSSKETLGQKFTTLNFTESVVINSESVFGTNEVPTATQATINSTPTSSLTTRESTKNSSSSSSSSSSSMAKKRKADSVKLSSSSLGNVLVDAVDINNSHLALRDIIKDVSVTLIPLPMDKTHDISSMDASDKLSSTKKPKTETINSSPVPTTHEPNIQNVSPNLMSVQVTGGGSGISIKQQAIPQTVSGIQPTSSNGGSSSSTSGVSIQSHIKPSILKDVSDSRNRSSSPYNAAAGLSSLSVSTPSLFVSVPLSTANVPGVSLPSTTANDLVAHSTRSSPHVNHHHSHHHSSNSLNSSSQSLVVERQSPRILQSQSVSASSTHISDTHSSSNASHQPNMSPLLSHGTGTAAMDTGGLKITYEKQNLRVAQLQEEQLPARRSRTPDSGNFSSMTNNNTNTNSSSSSSKDINGGLKFTYESQIGATSQVLPSGVMSPPVVDPVVKDSPPSSPGSEAGSARKRGRKSLETKDNMKVFFHNGGHVTHMLGNQLNPASSVAQKMSDQLHMEIEAHGVFAQPPLDPGPQLVGIPFPGKQQSSTRSSSQSSGSNSLASMLGGANVNSVSGNTPQSLEQLLERQWEQGSQFLMEQAQHFDIASLLSCLHQLRTENVRLEEHVNNLVARRDHLLAVNARLAIPLNPSVPPNTTLNNMHMNGPTTDAVSSRISRTNVHYNAQQMPIENGIDFRHSSHQSSTTNQTTIRHSSANSNYSSSTSSTHNQQHSVLSSSASSSSSRLQQQQSQHQQQQQQPPLPPSSSTSMPGMQGSSSALSSSSVQSSVESQIMRGSSGRGGSSSTSLSSASNPAIGGLVGAGGVNIGSSSYHNATQQSAAYSTVHQSQLRRDDSHGKPS